MAETISMPKLGFDMREGLLVRWVRNEGESVKKGDVLAEIETDKATVEVESSASGVVRKLLVEAGTVVPIGDAIAIVGSADEKIELPVSGAGPTTRAKADEKPVPEPQPTMDSAQHAGAAIQTGLVKASPLAKKMARDNREIGRASCRERV